MRKQVKSKKIKVKSLILLTFAFFLLPFTLLHAAVGYDTSSTASFAGVFGGTWQHTVTGTNTAIICTVTMWEYSGDTTATFSYNSVSLTPIGSVGTAGFGRAIQMFSGVVSACSACNATFTSDLEINAIASCTSFTGAHQTTPTGTAVTSTAITTGVNATVPTNGMSFDVAYINPGSTCETMTPGAGQTGRINFNTDCTIQEAQISASTRTSGSLFAWTYSGGPFDNGMIAVPISEAVASTAIRRRVVQ